MPACTSSLQRALHIASRRARPIRSTCIALASLCTLAPGDQLGAQSARATGIDVLALAEASSGATLPAGWVTRAVRGQQLPMSRIVDTSGIRYMRLHGQGHAGWFVRELPRRLADSRGRLHWTWRAPVSPPDANLSQRATDDAVLRVFVVFARHGRFERQPRVLYYALADGIPTPDRADAPFAVRVAGRPGAARAWVHAHADPFSDYRHVWGSAPPPIVAIGVMQDSDQTRQATIGDIAHLTWRPSDAELP